MAPQACVERLRRHDQFEAVLALGFAATGRYFLVRGKPNGMSYARLGVVVGRRAIARAVDRNRSKRVVREVFRAMKRGFPALDMVVLCRQAVPRTEGGAARAELSGLFHVVGKSGSSRIAKREQ